MNARFPVYIGGEALSELTAYCRGQGLEKFTLVSDLNTYQALGAAVEKALKEQGAEVLSVVLQGPEIIADEHYLVELFRDAGGGERTYLAAGSGTITDITRFVSHRTRNPFIALPTAPSVDGYASLYAPLVIGGFKQSVLCQSPMALFADLNVLRQAPPRMIAAGFGDLIGKYVAVADWKLGHLVWGEAYDVEIARRSRQAAENCAHRADEIATGSEAAVRALMDGLIESGFCMLDAGNSAPASGAEHYLSHHWEMRLLQERRPALLHGAKVGVGAVIAAGWFQQVRLLSRAEAARRLEDARLPEPEQVEAQLRHVYGLAAESVIQEQADFIRMDAGAFAELKGRILENWEAIREAAEIVPEPGQIAGWLRRAGAPVSGQELGLSEAEVGQARQYSHYLRRRFTVNKLRLLLGIE